MSSLLLRGGANVLGGEGTVFGTILGVTVLAVIVNGLILRIPTYWQQIVVGIIILAAVCLMSYRIGAVKPESLELT